jgi:hypothetical protein
VLIIVIVKHRPLIIFWTTTSAACRPRRVIPKLRWQTFETAIIERYRRRESPVEGRGGTEALIEMAARIGGASLPRRETSCSSRSRFGELSSHRGWPVSSEMRYPDIKTVVPYGPTHQRERKRRRSSSENGVRDRQFQNLRLVPPSELDKLPRRAAYVMGIPGGVAACAAGDPDGTPDGPP